MIGVIFNFCLIIDLSGSLLPHLHNCVTAIAYLIGNSITRLLWVSINKVNQVNDLVTRAGEHVTNKSFMFNE